jgi:hypothetical protein
MKKLHVLLLSFYLFSISSIYAQETTELEKVLAEMGLTQDDLNNITDGTEEMDNYAYKVKSEESGSSGDHTVKEMAFDPRKKVGERWTLLTVNGAEPTKEQMDSFNKEKNDEDDHIEEQDDDLVREEDAWIESNTANELVIGFKFNKKKLHHSQKILKHFNAKLVIDKTQQSIKAVELQNFEPFTMLLVFKIDRMQVKLNFKRLPDGSELIDSSVTTMSFKIMGGEANSTINETYFDYEKVL